MRRNLFHWFTREEGAAASAAQNKNRKSCKTCNKQEHVPDDGDGVTIQFNSFDGGEN
jgi:hypothetical protein